MSMSIASPMRLLLWTLVAIAWLFVGAMVGEAARLIRTYRVLLAVDAAGDAGNIPLEIERARELVDRDPRQTHRNLLALAYLSAEKQARSAGNREAALRNLDLAIGAAQNWEYVYERYSEFLASVGDEDCAAFFAQRADYWRALPLEASVQRRAGDLIVSLPSSAEAEP